ncbi:MAG TPA: ribokinase [Armatimonadota bacterium]|nr:ribokinase [Armatimonadota bacterium]
MADVVVLGSLNVDLVVRTERMPRPGETVLGDQFGTVPGGKGANQAAAAARLGARVEMVGCLGDDPFGPTLRNNLQALGVGTARVRTVAATATGIAMIVVDAHGENSIVVAPGANAAMTAEDVQNARALMRGARYLVMQCEVPVAVIRAAAALAAELRVPVILNAAPAHGIDREILAQVAYVIVNEHEAEHVTGIPVQDLDAAGCAGLAMLAMGVAHPIVTLGPNGALFASRGSTVHVPARPVNVVDTTAAGDAFVGALTVALLRDYPLREAVRYATCAGTLATTVLGAQPSLPSAERVDAFYRGGPA